MIEQILLELQIKSMRDESKRKSLLATRDEKDPLLAFCKRAEELGYDIPPGELVASGENFCDAMLRSVNGGGVEAEYGWEDSYELFMAALESADK